MANDHDGFAFVLMNDTVEGSRGSQHKLYPGLGARQRLQKGLLIKWDSIKPSSEFLHTDLLQILGLARAPFLYLVIKYDRQTEGGSNNLGRLLCAQHGTCNQHIGRDFACSGQAVTQTFGLLDAKWR